MIKLKLKANWKQFFHPSGGTWFRWRDVNIHQNCFHVFQLRDAEIPGGFIL